MARTIPGAMDLDATKTRTFYLAELRWPSGTVRYSSREQMVIGGNTYLAAGLDLRLRSISATGYIECLLILPTTPATTALFSNELYQGRICKLYEGEGAAITDIADAVLLLDGIMGGYSHDESRGTYELICKSARYKTRWLPPFRYEVFDFLPEPGSKITIAGDTKVL